MGPEQEPAEENGAMRIEACDGEQVDDFVVVEDGTYRMRVGEVRPARTGDGRESWMLRMELDGGDLAGRTAVLGRSGAASGSPSTPSTRRWCFGCAGGL